MRTATALLLVWAASVLRGGAVEADPMSETLLKAYANSRGTSPGAKKLLNIPEDGAEPLPGRYAPADGYADDLERDHALPTSVPNADILKTNSNPTYHKPRPSHHGAGVPPSYSPPSRGSFTPPLPPEYKNPFSDKPTLRGTNAESGGYVNRRPIPPPSHVPGHARIPIRQGQEPPAPQVPSPPASRGDAHQKKKALNTPSLKADGDGDGAPSGTDDAAGGIDSPERSNYTDYAPYNIPAISRILSGPNGRPEDIPEIFLRSVTAVTSGPSGGGTEAEPPRPEGVPRNSSTRLTHRADGGEGDGSTERPALPVVDPEAGGLDRPLLVDANGEANTRRNLQFATNRNSEGADSGGGVASTASATESSTERLPDADGVGKPSGGGSSVAYGNRNGSSWPLAWHLHVYLATAVFTILAVCSISKIFCYNKFTHLFTQYYFVVLHLLLVLVCLMRIFYMCYDPYNINDSLPVFLSEILLHVPEIFLSVAFSATVLFLLTNSVNLKNGCYSFAARPRTVIVGGLGHVTLCVVLHVVENIDRVHRELETFERRTFGLACQIIYVVSCLTLGLVYLYVYKTLKKILQKKSHSYIQGFQNLYQAIHINLATAMLFILLALLQIYGLLGIRIQVSMTKFNWLQWGYQFSLRVIEMSIIALLCWVISLKVGTGTGTGLQHEKGDGHKISGLGLFPCAAGSSNEQFESDYPAICTTNTNLHTYTLRTGKPIYDANILRMPDRCCSVGFPVNCDNGSSVENYSGHSSIANATHSSSAESSNATSTRSASNHLIKAHQGPASGKMSVYVDNLSDEHYSNCEPGVPDRTGSDHEYNVVQYGNRSDFVRDIAHKNAPGSARNSQNNFERLSSDRLSSGNDPSDPRKKHRGKQNVNQKNQQSCMTLGGPGYETANRHYRRPHAADAVDYSYPVDNASFHISGIQTLNPVKNYYDSSSGKAHPGGFRESQRRNRIESSPSNSALASGGSQKRGKNNVSTIQDRPKSTDLYGFSENPAQMHPVRSLAAQQKLENDERQDASMLVAQDGFVRFRPLEDEPT